MYTAKVHDRAVQWRRGWNLTPYKKVGCADWILSGRLSCYSGNIAGDISYIIKSGNSGINDSDFHLLTTMVCAYTKICCAGLVLSVRLSCYSGNTPSIFPEE